MAAPPAPARAPPAQVAVVFDFTCPEAFVAHARARGAWAALPLEVAWVPCEARPGLVAPGVPRPPDLQALTPAQERAFAGERLPFKPSALLPPTRVALRASLWCDQRGGGEDFRDGAFRRLYERGLGNHLHDPEVLAGIVERCGLDPIDFIADMRLGACEPELRAAEAWAAARGAAPPSLVVGDEVLPADADLPALEAAVRAPGSGPESAGH